MRIVPVVLVAMSGLFAQGCVVRARAAVVEPVATIEYQQPATVEYQPSTYEGNTVYYTELGVPYVVIGGGVRWVPATYVHYGRLTAHWREHRTRYNDWYRRHPARRPY